MNPALAGFLRGLALAVAIAVLEAVAVYLGGADLPEAAAVYVPVVVLLLRTLEGELDRRRRS